MPDWVWMRAALLTFLLLAAGVVLVPASVAGSPARARAQASLLAGSLGEAGTVSARGDGSDADALAVDQPGVRIGQATVTARAARAGGKGTARAVSNARGIDLLDGLVRVDSLRRTATATGAGVAYAGSVRGLSIGARKLGDIEAGDGFSLDGKGSVVVNRGDTALKVTLGQAQGAFPAGTTISVGVATASAADLVAPTPTPTATATATPGPKVHKARKATPQKAARRRAPKVSRRLTGRRYAFPVYGKATAADDFGAARQIGAHQGNDVFAAFGAPVVAVGDGVVEKVGTLPISGNRLWLRTKAGDEFFYAHLSAFAPAAVDGHRVGAGTVLGFTGNTGDAEPTPPHVHFEIHPGGGDAIDPHAILLAWQQQRDVPSGAWLTRYGGDTAERPGALVELRDFIAAG